MYLFIQNNLMIMLFDSGIFLGLMMFI